MTTTHTHPYYATFYYPHTATLETAAASVRMKAPERGDMRTKGRSQTFARTRNGQVVVYDMGTNLSEMVDIKFNNVPQSEYAALIVFLDYVTWGGNKIKYVDYKGAEHIVRVYKNTVEAINQGETRFDKIDSTLYDFNLTLIDVTNNPIDVGQSAVPSQLAIHLADYNHPHNPLIELDIEEGPGSTEVERVLTSIAKHVTWIVVLYREEDYTRTVLIHASHNGTDDVSATSVDVQGPEVISEIGTLPSDITFDVSLTGSGPTRAMILSCESITDPISIRCRRIKV